MVFHENAEMWQNRILRKAIMMQGEIFEKVEYRVLV